jgi:cytochrome P450
VVVTTYNYGRYLARALDSILAQDCGNVEVIVIDDGSQDQTRTIVEQYVPRVRYIHQEHAGTFVGCRTGFRAAYGTWIMYVDADDRLRPGALTALRAAADADPHARLIVGRLCSIREDGRETVQQHLPLSDDPLANFARFASGRFHVAIAGALIHRSLLAPFDREPFRYPHSTDLAILGCGLLRGLVLINDITLDVFDHENRLRDNIASIHRSELKLVDMLFDPALLPAGAMRYRRDFVGYIQMERTRSYHRAGWHSLSWRSYVRAVAASPRMLSSMRNLRRAVVSCVMSLLRIDEGPIRRPPGNWLYGHHFQLWTDAIGFLDKCARRYGPVVGLRLHRRTYLLVTPEDAMHVLVANPGNYHKAGILRDDPVLANGMTGMEPPQHAEHRRIFVSRFQKRAVDNFAPLMIDVIDRHIARCHSDQPIDVAIAFKFMCGEIACRVTFGCDNPALTASLLDLVREAHHCAFREARAFLRWPRWVPLNRRRRYARVKRSLDQLLAPILEARLKQPGDDMLSLMLRSWGQQQPPTVAALRDPLLTLFIASFEPVSVTLTWALQLLAGHPQVQQRVAEEVASVIGARLPTADDLPELGYTQNVISEVQRMYPSEWLLTRTALADDRLPCGLLVRRGRQVMISPYLLGRDARYFSDPERFDPHRFAGERTWPRGAYIPFGAGPRVCLGEFFAKLQMTLSLAVIVSRWRIEPIAGEHPRVETANLFTSQPVGGHLMLRLQPRNSLESAKKDPLAVH